MQTIIETLMCVCLNERRLKITFSFSFSPPFFLSFIAFDTKCFW